MEISRISNKTGRVEIKGGVWASNQILQNTW